MCGNPLSLEERGFARAGKGAGRFRNLSAVDFVQCNFLTTRTPHPSTHTYTNTYTHTTTTPCSAFLTPRIWSVISCTPHRCCATSRSFTFYGFFGTTTLRQHFASNSVALLYSLERQQQSVSNLRLFCAVASVKQFEKFLSKLTAQMSSCTWS